ncbi:MAG: hypothetical protein U0821_20275 [Chloroflexota bacterium]
MAISLSLSTEDVLLAVLVREFRANQGSNFLGRTAVQKLMYFLKALGAPISDHFSIYYYGPFSEQLSGRVERLLAEGVLADTSPDRGAYSNYAIEPRGIELLERHAAQAAQHEDLVRKVVRVLGQLTPDRLELISTTHFAEQKLRVEKKAAPSADDVVGQVRQYKGERFSVDDIGSAYRAMVKAGLVATELQRPGG